MPEMMANPLDEPTKGHLDDERGRVTPESIVGVVYPEYCGLLVTAKKFWI
jgi:hypothetical protein